MEQVGFYNPLTKEKNLKAERVKYWISVGAKPSDTVYNMLVSEKIVEGKKVPKHKIVKKEGEPQLAVEVPKEEPKAEPGLTTEAPQGSTPETPEQA